MQLVPKVFLLALPLLSMAACSDEAPVQQATYTGPIAAHAGSSVPSTPQADIPAPVTTDWQEKPPGTLIEAFPAPALNHLDGAAQSLFVRYTSRDVNGHPSLASGLVLLPHQQKFEHGQVPLVLYGHMTTGAADACAPSHISPDSTELQKMQQGDEIAR